MLEIILSIVTLILGFVAVLLGLAALILVYKTLTQGRSESVESAKDVCSKDTPRFQQNIEVANIIDVDNCKEKNQKK